MEEVRRNTSRYERLGIKEITDHYDGIIRGLGVPPVIMGHSFGGLITQLLLDRGLGASAVAISPALIRGVYILPLAQAKVVGMVPPDVALDFDNLRISVEPVVTVICGSLPDQAALYALLDRLEKYHVQLLEFRRRYDAT